MDYKTEGGINDDDQWFQYMKWGKFPLRVRGFIDEPGYARHCAAQYHFSYEKYTTCVNGYWWCYGCWGHCTWWFSSFP